MWNLNPLKNTINSLLAVVIGVAFSLSFCMKDNNSVTIKLEYNLNKLCVPDSLYNLTVIDSSLWNKFNEHTQEEYTNFAVVFKGNDVTLYQFGCVNRSNLISCTHNNQSYIFISYEKKVILFTDKTDMKTPLSYLDELQNKAIVSKNEYKSFQSQIQRIITINQNAEKNKSEKRW